MMPSEDAWKIFEKNNSWFRFVQGDSPDKYHRVVKIGKDNLTMYIFDLEESTAGVRRSEGWIISREDSSYEKDSDKVLEDYFIDYTHPTKQEWDMFYMLFGVELPWNHESPLVFPEV